MIVKPEQIAARQKLATLTTGAWRATNKHRAETADVNARHGTADRAKVLVKQSDHPDLTAIFKLHAKAYLEHKRLTMPSVQDGIRMLAAGREFEHAKVMNAIANEIELHLDSLCFDYPNEIVSQRAKLNGLFDSRAWPKDIVALRAEFIFQTRYLPCPTDGAWSEWLMESAKIADGEIRELLHNALRRVVERCGSDGKLHDTVFTGLSDLLTLVPDFDFEGKYAAIVAAAKPLANVKADILRDNDDERSKTAASAQSILDLLGGIK